MDETQLISQLQQGNRIAYQQLVKQFGDMVYNVCLGYMKNNIEAEDLSQEVFIEVFRSVNQFRKDARLSTWIYRIAISKSLDELKKQQRKKRSGIRVELDDQEKNIQIKEVQHPGIELENKEQAAILWSCIENLPANQAIALRLNKFDQKKYSEIAEIMDVSLSAVESLIFRAKKNLKDLLTDYFSNEEHKFQALKASNK